MEVGQFLMRLVAITDPSGFDRAEQHIRRVEAHLENVRRRIANPVRVNLFDYFQQAVGAVGSGLIRLTGHVANFVEASLRGFRLAAEGLRAVLNPLGAIAGGLLNLLNPLRLLDSLFRAVGNVAQIAFGIVLGNALTSLIRKAFELIDALAPLTTGLIAGRIETQFLALTIAAGNAGVGIEELNRNVQVLRASGIRAGEAMQAITQGFQIGLTIDQIRNLARAAQDLAVVIGSDSTEAFQRLFQAVVSGDSQMLRFAGIMTTGTQILEKFAKANNTTVSALTETQRRTAFVNAIIEEAAQFAGVYEASLSTLGKRLSSFPRIFEDLQIAIGNIFTPLLAGGLGAIEQLVERLTRLFTVTKGQAFENVARGIGLTVAQLKELEIGAKTGGEAFEAIVAKVSGESGVAAESLRQMGADGKLAFDKILEAGRAFEASPLALRLRGLAIALGTSFEKAAKESFARLFNITDQSLEEWSDRAINWGIDFVGNLAEGILRGVNETVIPAVSRVAQIIADYLMPGSGTREGVMRNLPFWGAGIARTILEGFKLADFSELNFLGSLLQSLLGEDAEKARALVGQALFEIRTLGGITTETLANVKNITGAAGEEFARYLALLQQFNIASQEQEQLQEEIKAATEAVLEAEKRLRDFEQATADIPERYTRGRREQLETEIDARRREAELKQQTARDNAEALRTQAEQLQLQRAILQEMARAAEVRAKQTADEVDNVKKIQNAIEEAAKRFAEQFGARITAAFAPARQQFEILSAFINGLLGQAAAIPEPPKLDGLDPIERAAALAAYAQQKEALASAHQRGENLRTTLESITTNLMPKLLSMWEALVKFLRQAGVLLQAFWAGLSGEALGAADEVSGLSEEEQRVLEATRQNAFAFGKSLRETLAAIRDIVLAIQPVLTSLVEFAKTSPELWDRLVALMNIIASPEIAKGLVTITVAINKFKRDVTSAIEIILKAFIALDGFRLDLSGVVGPLSLLFKIVGAVSDAAQRIAEIFARMMEEIVKRARTLSPAALAALKAMVTGITELFKKLFDALIGNSIVPDITEGIIGEFTGLNQRVATPLNRFRSTVEGQIGAIDAKMGLGMGGALPGRDGQMQSVTITVDQSGWVFPANMDENQKAELRRIAREESYAGIVAVFQTAKA